MQASIGDEIRWRQTLYSNILAHCEQGRFSFARFLALVADRLRLSVGESLAKIQIPVFIDGAFVDSCADSLLPRTAESDDRPLEASAEHLRRAIRLAQIDGNLDAVTIATWLGSKGDRFLKSVGALYVKGLREVGHGEGGEETAYLVHLLILHAYRQALARGLSGEPLPGDRAFVGALLEIALQGVLSAAGIPDQALSARLGFQFAVTTSPLSLGAAADQLLNSSLNPYRTSARAVHLARAVLQGPLEKLRLDSCAAKVAGQLLGSEEARTALARDLLYELVRDCLLLAVLKHFRPRPAQLFKTFRRLAGSSDLLRQHVSDPARRSQLIHLIDIQPQGGDQPLPTLRKLLVEGERALLGTTRSLRAHGDLEKRAELSATGALLLVLDERVEQLRCELLARIRFLSAAEMPSAYEDGRCYWLCTEDRPLFQLPKARQEAHLFVDLKDFTERTAAIKEQAMGDFLKRYFYQPIFEVAARLKGSSAHTLSVVNILGDAVAFRGEIQPIVSLALAIRRILAEAAEQLAASLSDVLGGADTSLAEIEVEIAEVKTSIDQADAQLRSGAQTGDSNPAEHRKRLLAKLQMLEEARAERTARTVGRGLQAGAFISFGAAAERVDLSHPSLGPWSVSIGERLNEAARGTARSAAVRAQQDAILAAARLEQANPQLAIPFEVRVGRRSQAELPSAMAEALEGAVYRGDKTGVTTSVRTIAQWLHQLASEAVDHQERGIERALWRSEELYNAGCALSGAALDAFEKAGARALRFERLEVYRSQLPPSFQRAYLLEYDPERFVLVRDPATGALVHLLRYGGRAMFKGLEKEGGTEVWELLLADSPFGRDLLAALGMAPAQAGRPPKTRPASGEERAE